MSSAAAYHPGDIERALRHWDDLLAGAVAATVRVGTDWAAAEAVCALRADVWCALRWLASFNPPAARLLVESFYLANAEEADDDRDDRLAASRGVKRATLRRFRNEALGLMAAYLNDGETD